jgi:hypothetical protein
VEGNVINLNTPQGVFVNGNEVATVNEIPTIPIIDSTVSQTGENSVKSSGIYSFVSDTVADYPTITEMRSYVQEETGYVRGEVQMDYVLKSAITDFTTEEQVNTAIANSLNSYSSTADTLEYIDGKVEEIQGEIANIWENLGGIEDTANTALNEVRNFEIPELPDLNSYVRHDELPVPLSQIIPDDEIQPVSSVAVISYIDTQIPPTPTITFKTEFINVYNWRDLSTCWILLNVCHIEFNMIMEFLVLMDGDNNGSQIGELQVGMPVPSENVAAQLAGLSGIFTLRLEPNGAIYLANFPVDTINPNTQISVSIFYTFTDYKLPS